MSMRPGVHGPADAAGIQASSCLGEKSPFARLLMLRLSLRYHLQGNSFAFVMPILLAVTTVCSILVNELEASHRSFSFVKSKLSWDRFNSNN